MYTNTKFLPEFNAKRSNNGVDFHSCMFRNNFSLKNNNCKLYKAILKFLDARKAAINFFQVNLNRP